MIKSEYKVIFIPGGGVTPAVSQSVVEELSRLLGIPMHLIPYPEYINKNFQINIENYKIYFRDYVAKERKKLIVIGFSLGAYFALDLVQSQNNKIAGVILISPFIKNPGSFVKFMFNRAKSWINEQSVHAEYYRYPWFDVIRDFVKYRREILGQLKEVIFKINLDKKLLDSNTKMFVIMGDNDYVTPKFSRENFNMKYTKVIRIPGGHDILTNREMKAVPVLREIFESF